MELYYTIVFFIFGTVFGSFFNVVGSRLPNGESIVNPPSHCSNCNHKLGFWELFPIISYIFLGGKCKNCKTKISIIHPLFELLTGLLFSISYRIYGLSFDCLIALTFISALLIVIVSDFNYMIIPDEILFFFGMLLIIEILFTTGFESTLLSITDGIISFIFMFVLKLFGDLIFKRESMGGGDIKLLCLFGIILGWQNAIVTIFLAALIGLPISLIILIKNKDNVIPFGPFLSIAAIIILLTNFDIGSFMQLLINI